MISLNDITCPLRKRIIYFPRGCLFKQYQLVDILCCAKDKCKHDMINVSKYILSVILN